MTTAHRSPLGGGPVAATIGRAYFAAQAVAGAAWWVAVFTVPLVREATLGALDPTAVAAVDIPLFVVTSGLAAVLSGRAAIGAASVATAWTIAVTALLAVYATVTALAGVGVILMIAASVAAVGAWFLLALGRIPTEWLLVGPFAFRPARPRRTPLVHVVVTLGQIVVFSGACSSSSSRSSSTLSKRGGACRCPRPSVSRSPASSWCCRRAPSGCGRRHPSP